MTSKAKVFNSARKMLQPINVVPYNSMKHSDKTQASRGYKLMLDLGIIRASSPGLYSILPLGIRSLNKLRNVIKLEMSLIDAQEVKLPHLTDSELWKKTGRWDSDALGMFSLKDRHKKDIILSPTNEEVAADLIASIPQLSHHQLPLLVYQISTKFRDELKPRCGLLKSKEFEMKDLYSFDKSLEDAKLSYESVSISYKNIFESLGIPVMKVNADTGAMKGIFSHEYQVSSDLGEDIIIKCDSCSYCFNSEQMDISECKHCKSKSISSFKGIEVGHTFLLDTVYSIPLNAIFKTASGLTKPVVMASYGLGLTRTLAAGIECLSSEDGITWPSLVAPFSVTIITPKNGSKEYQLGKTLSVDLYEKLNEIPYLTCDVLIDDRESLSIGKRLLHAKRMGYPFVIVLGSKITRNPPLFEIFGKKSGIQKYVTFEEVVEILIHNGFKKSSLTSSFA